MTTSTETHADKMIDVLSAPGPFPEYADKLMLFGRLVGSWDIEGAFFDEEGNVSKRSKGEWHFGWVLEGRAIADVILTPPLAERARTGEPAKAYDMALRVYDPKTDTWRVTAEAPIYGAGVHLIAREVGDEIWLEGLSPDGKPWRWVFSEVTDESFTWRGYESADGGATWVFGEEILGRRRR